jgi:hypothetical protein
MQLSRGAGVLQSVQQETGMVAKGLKGKSKSMYNMEYATTIPDPV